MADFTSFVDLDNQRPTIAALSGHSQSPIRPPKIFEAEFLPDEIEAAKCEDVSFSLQFDAAEHGRVSCTNVRLRFTPFVYHPKEVPRRTRLIDDFFDIALCSIAEVYYSPVPTDGSKGKQKFLHMKSSLSSMEVVSIIRIVLKDFRVATIDLRCSQNGTHLANQMLFFSKVTSLETLVQLGSALDDKGAQLKLPFNGLDTWSAELRRCGQSTSDGSKWRVCALHREGLANVPHGYPMYVVVSAFLARTDIDRLIQNWKLGRLPIWVWSRSSGNASLLISSEHENNLATPELLSKLAESVTRCHSNDDRPYSLHLPNDFLAKVAKSYGSLLRLCAIDSYEKFTSRESSWLSHVSKTGWLHLVRDCLARTSEVISWLIDRDRTVILYEEEGRDMSIVVASLAQICCDPYYRTTIGLQHLIDKMWISLGHPFGARLLGRRDDASTNPAFRNSDQIRPTWLLFLDCVAQLLNIYPLQFHYSSHLLIALWDISLTGFVPSMVCNCIDEQLAGHVSGGPFPLDTYFYEGYTSLFSNVYSDAVQFIDAVSRKRDISLAHLNCDTIRPPTTLCDVIFWSECYERWIPPANAKNASGPLEAFSLDATMSELAAKTRSVMWRSQYVPPTYSSAYPYSPPDAVERLSSVTVDAPDDDDLSFASLHLSTSASIDFDEPSTPTSSTFESFVHVRPTSMSVRFTKEEPPRPAPPTPRGPKPVPPLRPRAPASFKQPRTNNTEELPKVLHL